MTMTVNHKSLFNPTEPSAHIARWIESYGVGYELVEVPIYQFDAELSLHNQARGVPMDIETARVYRDAMKAGAIFPPVVGQFHDGKVVLVDGNHRLRAAIDVGADMLWVYVVIAQSDTVILDMVASANAILNGKEALIDDRIKHAMRMVAAGATMSSAARQTGISASTLKRHISAADIKRKAAGMGMTHFASRLELGYLEKMEPIADDLNSDLFPCLVGAAEASPSLEEFARLVRAVKGMSPELRTDAVVNFTETHQKPAINKRKAAGRIAEPWQSFLMHGAAINKLDAASIVASIPSARRADIEALAEDIRYLANRVLKEL